MVKNKRYLPKIMIFQKRTNPIISIELKAEFQFLFFSFFLLIFTCYINFKLHQSRKFILKNNKVKRHRKIK